jgi:glucose/arabinose dehydrogenase
MRVAAALALCLALAGSAAGRPERRLALEAVASGFVEPTQVAVAPGEPGRLYVVERAGRIRVVAGRRTRTFLDIRRLVLGGGLRGLYSVAFHPHYRTDRRLYVQYAGRDGALWVVEYRGRTRRRALLRIPDAVHNAFGHYGGQLAFGWGGDLFVAIGDGENEGDAGTRAQDLTSAFGKILRVDVDGRRPPVTVAYGLRNPWRFSFDRATGELYVGDVGERRWEEVDRISRRARLPMNLGWPLFEGRERHSAGESAGVASPIAVYRRRRPLCSIIGGFVYRGRAVPRLTGRYVFGDLCTGAVWSLPARGERPVVRREALTVPAGIYSFGEDGRDELYVAAMDGTVSRLVSR